MKKILLALAILFPATAFADSCSKSLIPLFTPFQAAKLCSLFSAGTIGTIANNTFATARNAANGANLNIWKADGTDNTHLNAGTGKVVNFDIAVTPVAKVDVNGLTMVTGDVFFATVGKQPVFPTPAAVITPSTTFPTPNAGDTLASRYTILAAGAPTAAFVELPRATASVGKTFSVFNQGSNPLAIVPQSGDTQGVSAAATPFSCTTLKSCDCTGLTTGNFMCGLR